VQLQCEIHQGTLAQGMLYEKLLHHQHRLWQEVGTKTTDYRCKFTKDLVVMKTATKDETYGAAHMSTDN
jgi:hypothetical protein